MDKPCGCRIVYDDAPAIFPKNDRIEFCALHEAAGIMSRSLVQIIEFAENDSDSAQGLRAKERILTEIVLEAEQALESAGFQMPADDSEMPLGPIKVYGETSKGKTKGGFTS